MQFSNLFFHCYITMRLRCFSLLGGFFSIIGILILTAIISGLLDSKVVTVVGSIAAFMVFGVTIMCLFFGEKGHINLD